MALTGSTRTIAIIAGTAVVSLAAGLGLSRLIVSPADAAAASSPPAAREITVPVELRALSNDIVMRGDALYEDPLDVTVETGDLNGPAVVTGQVPTVGATIDAGQVVLEVTGRPVILLTGELPVYRTLRAGVSGPDVVQLKQALAALGIAAGNPSSDAYDAATAAGVQALYGRVGYSAPTAGEAATEALRGAQDMLTGAQEGLASAQRELASAKAGPSGAARVEADNRVRAAERALADARTAGATQTEIDNLADDVTLAVAARNDLLAPVDVSGAQAQVTAAQKTVAEAQADLKTAREATLTPLPAGEVVYLPATPRRVDSVAVRRGATVAGTAVMSVSGATLQIRGTVADSDADLVTVGMPVKIALPGGESVPGTVKAVGAEAEAVEGSTGWGGGSSTPAAGRTSVVVVPDSLTEEQRAELQGSNVRVTIPVGSTEGEVLAVPLAALTAGPGGETRVEVLRAGAEDTELVVVTTGLAAGGYVEVTPVSGSLEVGDRVVVGIDGGGAGDEGSGDEESEDEGSTEEPSAEPTG